MHNVIKMTTLAIVFVISSVYFNGVLTQSPHAHVHPKKVNSEHYVVKVKQTGNKPLITWTLNEPDPAATKNNAAVIFQAIGIWAHGNSTQGAFSGQGYQGLEIEHFVDGKYIHTFNLPRCMKGTLGKAIIVYTSGNALTDAEKSEFTNKINLCKSANAKV